MKAWVSKNRLALWATGLVGLYIASVLINLGVLNLRVEEARRALVSLEMLQSGDYLQPHTLGWAYYNKPPVFNWVMSLFIWLAGDSSEFVLRLPSFVCLLLTGLFHYLVARKFIGRAVAALSVGFTLTSADLYFYVLSNGAEIDVFYSLVVYLQAISMFWFYEKKNYWLLFLFSWALCAIGFLTKGYPSVIFQGLTLVALVIHGKSLKPVASLQHLAGIILFLLLTGGYYYLYSRYHDPEIPLANLLNESLRKSAVGEETTGRFYRVFTYPVVLFRVLAPWILFLLLLVGRQRFRLWSQPLLRFSLLFILLNIGVYWVTGAQKTRYIIMFIPFVMVIVSFVYWQFERQNPGKMDRYLKWAGILFCLALAGIASIPFFADVGWWKLLLFGGLLLVFTIIFFKVQQHRIWWLLAGFILLRLSYAAIGLPLKEKGEFDYANLANRVIGRANDQPLFYWEKPDTLNLNVVVGDTLHRWTKQPVRVLPTYIRYQVPYYLYRANGSLVRFDTTLVPGRTYISYYPSYLPKEEIEVLDSLYDKPVNSYLVMFRKKGK